MATSQGRHVVERAPIRSGPLRERLTLMFEWYRGMVDAETGRLVYLYDPERDAATSDGEPIRDIAAVWDIELLSAHLGRHELAAVIERSLTHFSRWVVEQHERAVVSVHGESPSIAHNAFLALALAHSALPDKRVRLTPLTNAILGQQRDDGSFQIFFDGRSDYGEELYPAEAMLALLDTYPLTRDIRHLRSAERGYTYYQRHLYGSGRVAADDLVFFANWQSQVGRLLFEASDQPERKAAVCADVCGLHDRIIAAGFYDQVAHRPEAQACVEVACALEGLADAHAVATVSREDRAHTYRRCIGIALEFLCRAQRTADARDRERGGFGASLARREQRIDVTGHVASGFMKCWDQGITGARL